MKSGLESKTIRLSVLNHRRTTVPPCSVADTGLEASPSSLKSEWMDSVEAAEYLRLSVGALRNLTSNGHVPFYKLGNRNRYLKSELQNLLLKNRRGGS